MEHKTFKPIIILAIAVFMTTLWSCSKDETIPSVINDEIQADEILAKEPAAGTYVVTKFIDNGNNETAQFTGYTFQFLADGNLIATTADSTVVDGLWTMNMAETKMKIKISGTQGLNDVDGDWQVIKITDTQIALRASGPDRILFTKL